MSMTIVIVTVRVDNRRLSYRIEIVDTG